MKLSQTVTIVAGLSAIVVNCHAQKVAESKPEADKPATVEPLTQAQLEKLLNARYNGELGFSFRDFANMFVVSSVINFGTVVGLMTDSQRIAECELQPIYPANYRPTLRQFLDRIGLQASATWKSGALKSHTIPALVEWCDDAAREWRRNRVDRWAGIVFFPRCLGAPSELGLAAKRRQPTGRNPHPAGPSKLNPSPRSVIPLGFKNDQDQWASRQRGDDLSILGALPGS